MDNFELAHECLDSAYGSSSCDERLSGRLAEISAAVGSLETATAELQQQLAEEQFINMAIPEVQTLTKSHLLNDKPFYWRNKNFNESSSSLDSMTQQDVEPFKGLQLAASCKFDESSSLSSTDDSDDEHNYTLVPDPGSRRPGSGPLSITEQKRNLFMLASQRALIQRYADQSTSALNAAPTEGNASAASRARAKARAKGPIGTQLRVRKQNGVNDFGAGGSGGAGNGGGVGRRGRSSYPPQNRSVQKIRKLLHDGGGDADGGIDGDDDATPPASARRQCRSFNIPSWIFCVILLTTFGYLTVQLPSGFLNP